MDFTSKRYPDYLKPLAPRIHLSVKREYELIYSYYHINRSAVFDFHDDPRKIAECKVCGDKINIVCGSGINSSYTVILTHHLRKHTKEYEKYLIDYSLLLKPDSKTIHEHFDQMNRPRIVHNEELKSQRFKESQRNWNLKEKNAAGVAYAERDRYYLIEINKDLIEDRNAKMIEFIHRYTNQNIWKSELMGTNLMGVNLLKSYKKSKCLVDNDGDIITDLQRLFCKKMCFFDPELYGNCSEEHNGDIALFSDEDYLNTIPGFKEEIEKYPEMQSNKSFDHKLLKATQNIERRRVSLIEMSRMLTIITSLITIAKDKIESKVEEVISKNTKNGLVKPDLAIHGWGPKMLDMDISNDDDISRLFDERKFSTFKHLNRRDCPGYTNVDKRIYSAPFLKDGKFYYPCDVGGCAVPCSCPPCNNSTVTLKCPDHAPDHPALFVKDAEIMIMRRVLFESEVRKPIFDRPSYHPRLCPPPLKLANLRKQCVVCTHNVKEHTENHYTLHTLSCEICEQIDFVSRHSYALICHVCLKKFDRKHTLEDHLKKHSSQNPYCCDICNCGFSSRFNLKRHLSESHQEAGKIYFCCQCEAKFGVQRSLDSHTREKHNEVTHFKCDICENSYTRDSSLKRHKRITHNIDESKAIIPGTTKKNKNLNECVLCESMFTQKTDLNRHIKTVHNTSNNSQEKFQCKTCNKDFQRIDHLQRHKKIHQKSSIKIVCEVCLNHFVTKDELKMHRIANHEKE